MGEKGMGETNHSTVTAFINVINEIVNQKLATLDQAALCQVVSDDVGSGLYNLRLVTDPTTIIKDVVNDTPFSFKNGDYVYILKIKNRLDNAIIIGTQRPHNMPSSTITTTTNTTVINEGTAYRDGDAIQY